MPVTNECCGDGSPSRQVAEEQEMRQNRGAICRGDVEGDLKGGVSLYRTDRMIYP